MTKIQRVPMCLLCAHLPCCRLVFGSVFSVSSQNFLMSWIFVPSLFLFSRSDLGALAGSSDSLYDIWGFGCDKLVTLAWETSRSRRPDVGSSRTFWMGA